MDMVKINNIPDQDDCIAEEVYRDIWWMKDQDCNGLFQDLDGGQRKIAEFPEDFDIAQVQAIREGKAFLIEGKEGRKLTLMRGYGNQYYAVGNAAKTDDKGRVVLSKKFELASVISNNSRSGHSI